jgi:tetratricopeptide (TPR) repeat protein
VLTHRPGYAYPLGDRAFFNRRTLRSLADEDSSRLASQVLATSGMPPDLRDLVIERAEGNPFYIEEVVHAVVESGAVRLNDDGGYTLVQPLSDVRIPDTVQGVILSRLDRLSWEAKELVQHAAIIGRSFPVRLVEHVLGPDADAARCLDELKALDLVYERAYFPELECMFKHALTHEVALSTLLAERRREMHRQVASAIESLYADRRHDYAESLARHYFAGEDWERALTYARDAAERSRQLHAPRAAVEHLSRAIEAIEHLGRARDTALLRQRALAYESIGRFDDARADHEAIIAIARASEDLRPEWQAHVDLGMLWAGRDYVRAGEYWRRASELAEMDGDAVMIASSLNRIGNWHINVEQPIEARAMHERALAIFEGLGDADGVAETLDFLSMTLGLSGDSAGALQAAERAIALFRAAGNKRALAGLLTTAGTESPSIESRTLLPSLLDERESASRIAEALALCRELMWSAGEAFALMVAAMHEATYGRYGEALERASESRTIAEAIGHRQWEAGANCISGILYNELQQPARARPLLERALMLAHEVGSTYWQRECAGHLAAAWLMDGDCAQAQRVIEAGMTLDLPALTVGQRELWMSYGQLMAAQQRWPDVRDVIERLSHTPGLDGDIGRLPHVAMLAARAHQAAGETAEAERLLRAAVATADAWRVSSLQWQTRAALGAYLAGAGRAADAAAAHRSAAAVIDAIARSLPEGAMRDGFLVAPRVAAVLASMKS